MAERDSDLHRSVFVQLVISVCHANARRLKSRPTEAPRSHLYHPQFPRVRGKPPSDSPACGGKKGGCHAERSEASEIPPNQNTAKPPNLLLPQCSRSALVQRAFRFFASLRMTRWGRIFCASRQACKLRTHVNRLSAVSSPPAVTPSVNPLSLTANLYFSV